MCRSGAAASAGRAAGAHIVVDQVVDMCFESVNVLRQLFLATASNGLDVLPVADRRSCGCFGQCLPYLCHRSLHILYVCHDTFLVLTRFI